MNEEKCIRLAAARASTRMGVGRGELMTAVVTAKFPWVREGEIVWSRTANFKHSMFWIKPDEELVLLNGKDRMSALSSLFDASIGSLPGDLPADTLAQAIRQLGEDPRGLLAGHELLERVNDSLSVWLKKDDAHDRQLFIDANTDAVLRAEGDHGWRLDFKFFTPKGGVEAWKVEGDHASIQVMECADYLPEHTFFWPMA
jgi:hypothetical protein